jgi:SAM-dependent methyltransferase
MARRSLLDIFARVSRPFYDAMYRRGAPWESGPRPELVTLVESGRITPDTVGPRALDLGCGSGADSIYLASRGFDTIGVDLSPVAIDKARAAAGAASSSAVFVVGDLLDLPEEVEGPFDFVFDGGTIDDFPPAMRPRVVDVVARITRPDSVLVMWCFYARDADLPRFSTSGPSRWGSPGIEPAELAALFAGWEVDRVAGGEGEGFACFVMTRR